VELTNDDVQDILQVLDGLPYDELHLETARFRLSLRRQPDGAWTQATEVLGAPTVRPSAAGSPGGSRPSGSGVSPGGTVSPRDAAAAGLVTAGAAAASLADDYRPEPTAATEADDGLAEIRAPLLGTFYRAPRPGVPPFVSVGSTVRPDTVVCIIETMKLMNSVTAGVSGTVAQIVLANAQFADQGAVLMRIRPLQDGERP